MLKAKSLAQANEELLKELPDVEDIKKTLSHYKGVPVFFDESEEAKYVSTICKYIRYTPEYKSWTDTLKTEYGLDKCVFTGETTEKGSVIELHHHPFRLSDIVVAVCDLLVSRKSRHSVTSLDIAKKVIEMHYDMEVGIVPLIRSLHQKFHNHEFDIPTEWIIGKWTSILQPPFTPRPYMLVVAEKALQSKSYHFTHVLWPED